MAPEVEIAPPELAGLRLVVPTPFAAWYSDDYEPKMRSALRRLVRPGDVCADLGAHAGYFALLMSALAGPAGRVIAFEPRAETRAYLERNLAMNPGGAAVEVRAAAVAARTTSALELHCGGYGSELRSTLLASVAEREAPETRHAVSVAAVTLDDGFPAGEPLDVVKMDIEGAEAFALLGARRLLAEQRPTFVVEYHGSVAWPIIGHLAEAGYRFEACDGSRIPVPAEPDAVPSHFVAVPT
jgi:FkbM family methyltransferase